MNKYLLTPHGAAITNQRNDPTKDQPGKPVTLSGLNVGHGEGLVKGVWTTTKQLHNLKVPTQV